MALQFVLGSSGSGKTEYIYERLVRQAGEHPKKNYLVIVPEQFTMQTQQKLVELAPNHAIMNIDVLSFKRLAYRVFDDMGMQDIQVLEETGKNLVLRRLAQEQEETLTVLRANMNRMGYIGEVKSMISELVQYRISPEQLVDLTEDKTISPVLSAKLRDVTTMYRPFSVFERYRHSYDVFPDCGRTQPFGSGATCVYPYRDLMIRNDTQTTFRLHVIVGGEFLEGEWRADRRPEYSYRVVERDHCMQSEYWGGYSRHNKLYREVYDAEGRCVDVQYVTRNDALMMYSPFLAENAQPGKRPADNQRPGYE